MASIHVSEVVKPIDAKRTLDPRVETQTVTISIGWETTIYLSDAEALELAQRLLDITPQVAA